MLLPCEGDFDRDSDVDRGDLPVFAADFGRADCPVLEQRVKVVPRERLRLIDIVGGGSNGSASFPTLAPIYYAIA